MSMFSLNAGDSQNMGRRIFRRPYLFMRHRARRMERRLAGAVTAGGVAGAVAGSTISNRKPTRNTATKDSRGNTSTSSMGQRAGSKVGAVLDTKNKVKDKANAVKENIKDMPTQTAYAVYSAKEKAKSSVSDFKRGMVQEQLSRQTGRLERQEQHRQNIADKRMELKRHKKEGRHSERLTDQRQRELPVPMSDQPQLQPFQSRVQKKCRKSNVLPQQPLLKQVSQSRQLLSKSVRYLLVLSIGKRPSSHSQYIGRM